MATAATPERKPATWKAVIAVPLMAAPPVEKSSAAAMIERRAARVCGTWYTSGRGYPMPKVQQLFDLSGRVAIVTGGSRGLGQEMAEGLGEAGARLMLCARREDWLAPTLAELRGRSLTV